MNSHLDQVQELHNVSINADSNLYEHTPLLRKTGRTSWATLRRRYKNTRKCVSSKGALAILLWSFTVSTIYYLLLNPGAFTQQKLHHNSSLTNIIVYGAVAIIFFFYPIAGYLADNKYGRYKTVVVSLWLLVPSLILLIIYNSWTLLAKFYVCRTAFITIAVILVLISAILLAITSVTFNANVIQLGVDQLYDFPAEDQSLFIHWFIWVLYLTVLLVQLSWNMTLLPYTIFNEYANITDDYENISHTGRATFGLLVIVSFVLLVVSLCIAHCKKHWFLIEPSRVNPYKLVYKVTKFAWQHKVPVKRSAFTYCEDDIPSGLNLAKDKYGGPYTTEQVEDIKVFYGILKVLFSLGPVFFLTFAADVPLYQFTLHGSILSLSNRNSSSIIVYNRDPLKLLLIHDGLLTPLMTTICIPLYLFLLHPFLLNYTPGMLKRMGLGATLTVLLLMCTGAIGARAHTRYEVGCMFDITSTIITLNDTSDDLLDAPSSTGGPFYDSSLVAIPRALLSLSDMLIYIALYEFICSQSPHSMKGLLIGLSFAIKGLFQVIAALLALPFALAMDNTHISCGVSYYVMNTGVGVVTVLVYVWVANKYKNRERDEPSNIYMYAENYYSKGPPEERYQKLSRAY